MNIFNESGFEASMDEISEDIQIKFLDKLVSIADLSTIKFCQQIDPTV